MNAVVPLPSPADFDARRSTELEAFSALRRVVVITTEIFGNVRVFEDYDPEYPEDRYLVLQVEAAEPTPAILKMEKDWTHRVCQAGSPWLPFRLSVHVKS